MAKYIMQRILAMLVTLFIIITIGFMVIRLMPGGIFDDAVDMTYEQRTALEAKYNLDKPIPIQYAMFLKGLVLEGDWGTSLKMYVNVPVWDVIKTKIPVTLYINFFSLIISLPLGIILGIVAAIRKNTMTDYLISFLVIMTKNATQFITPITFETLTGHKCMVDTFDRDFKFEVTHISLAKKADVILVAPATANVIAKMAHGIADDMLTTVVLAAKCPKLVSPAMNTGMLENPITQDNLATLERYGFTVIPSESGVLACKDVGSGRLPKEDVLIEYILHTIARPKDLAGVRVTVTAGPTQEALDPVRYLTNHSTGKMGYALARAAAMRGADVTLIHGETALPPVKFTTDVPVTTAQDLYEAVTGCFDTTDVLIMAAAVADYRPVTVASDKIKKKDGDLSIPVERTPDILGTIGPQKTHQFLCGFSMETKDLVENSSAKLTKKNLDMVVANNLKVAGAGFGVDTNVVTFITPDGTRELPLMSKADVADAILDEILKRRSL